MTSNRFLVADMTEALGVPYECVSHVAFTVAGLHEVLADQCAPVFIDVAVMWCAKKGIRSVDWIREASEATGGGVIDAFIKAVGLEGSKAAVIKRRIQNLEAYLDPAAWKEVSLVQNNSFSLSLRTTAPPPPPRAAGGPPSARAGCRA